MIFNMKYIPLKMRSSPCRIYLLTNSPLHLNDTYETMRIEITDETRVVLFFSFFFFSPFIFMIFIDDDWIYVVRDGRNKEY